MWFCSLHADDVNHSVAVASHVFSAAASLGCRGVRTDISWKDLEPSPGVHDDERIAFYRNYFATACGAGLAPFAVLSQAPTWAKDLYSSENATAFFAAAEDYAALALQLVAPCAAQPLRVQLWNELNHLPSRWVRSGACELLSALGRGARRANATAQLWVNAMADDPLWHRAVDGWIDCAGGYIDAVGVDHYPGTWTLSSWTDWAPLDRLLDATGATGAWAGRAAGVLETGYSSWSTVVASEAMQASWVNASLPAMRARVRAAGAASRFEVANWYTLLDGVHTGVPPEEAHFGVLRPGTLERKPAFEVLADQLRVSLNS